MNRRSELILDPIFIVSLILLAVNDHVLKAAYENWFTGKLSDIAGLVVLPIFIAFLAPRLERWAALLSGVWFVFWKSPFSSGLIYLVNLNGLFEINRVVDYSDMLALLVLPFSHWLVQKKTTNRTRNFSAFSEHLKPILVISAVLTLCSTSMLYKDPYPEGTVSINKRHKLTAPKDTVLSRIKSLGLEWKYIQTHSEPVPWGYYQIDNIIVPYEVIPHGQRADTIKRLTFRFDESDDKQDALVIMDVTFSDTLHISDWRILKTYSKMYKDVTEKILVNRTIYKQR